MSTVKLEIYVPVESAEAVIAAITRAGAGRIGRYDNCVWTTAGTGRFRPLPGSRPALGHTNEIEHVAEQKIETLCLREHLCAVLDALRASHPYETPAFQYWDVELT